MMKEFMHKWISKLKDFWGASTKNKIIVIVVCFFLFCGIVGSGSDTEETTNTDSKPKQTEVKKESKPKTIEVKLKGNIKVDGFKIYSDLLACSEDLELRGRGWKGDKSNFYHAQGEYITVNLFAENISKEAKINNIRIKDIKMIIDDAKYDYDENLQQEYSLNKREFSDAQKVNPKMNQLQRFTFDVPKGTFDKKKAIYVEFKIDEQQYKMRVR